jgi:hypothetical protein
MGVFDDLGSTIASAEKSVAGAVGSIGDTVGGSIGAIAGGLASGLNSIKDGIGGVFSSLASKGAVTLKGVKLPLPNPLFAYATYNYVIGLSAMSDKMLNDPDNTYRKGKRADLICKSGSVDPKNRVKTAYGTFEFYIDDVKIQSQIGQERGANTNAVGNITFKIVEPYSMGLFFQALQVAAQKNGHGNWNEAPFLLTIDFRGNKETGQMDNIPGTSRQIPIKFSTMSMKVTEQGSIYDCTTLVYNQQAIADANAKFQSDMAIAGRTVQELLQTGEKSLQAIINNKLKEVAIINGIKKPDQILILFPKALASKSTSSTSSDSASQTTNTATTTPAVAVDQGVLDKLGVSQGPDSNLIQSTTTLNGIGAAKMGFSEARKGDAPMGKDNAVYNPTTKINERSKNTVNPEVSDFKFRQDTDILNAISQVIMASTYVDKTLDKSQVTPEGYKGWWNIDVQTYTNGEVNEATGKKPKILVYRVAEYQVHASSAPTAPNTKPPGYEQLKKQAVKQYNYIYTGKNVDVLKFEISYNANFANLMPADGGKKTQDKENKGSDGVEDKTEPDIKSLSGGKRPSTKPGTAPTSVSFTQTKFKSDKLGGGGNETESTRAARAFNDSITKGTDMTTLDMEIIGDPYFIVQSGTGNFTAQPTQYSNLNSDGSINHQSGEVDILVNFRTPVDINQSTGLYDFGKNASAPVAMFSGLYMVRVLTSTFSKNEFKQVLQLQRRPLQELSGPGTTNGVLSVSNKEPAPKNSQSPQVATTSPTELRTPAEVQASKDLGDFAG